MTVFDSYSRDQPVLETSVAGPGDAERWDSFVQATGGDTRYYEWAWGDIFSQEFRLPRHYLIAQDGVVVRGVLPLFEQSNPISGRFLTSLPFVNYGGPLGSASAAAALIRAADDLVRRRKARLAELRCRPGAQLQLPCSTHKVRAILDLPDDPEVLWKALRSKLRAQIRRPEKEGMEATVGGSELVGELYDLLSVKWRQLGSPLYRRSFFERVATTFPEAATIVVVRSGRETAGAGLVYTAGGIAEMIWAATRRELDRFSPNMLLYWTALESAIEGGTRAFDFGRSTRDAGTHRFKMQWGSRSEDLPWYYVLGSAGEVPGAAAESRAALLVRSVWPRLPLAVTRLLGPALARRLPL